MLSRLSARRSTAFLNQLLKPCVVAPTTQAKSLSVSSHQDNKYPWYHKSFPAIKMYKDLAGQSAGTVFSIGLISYLISKEIYVMNDEVILILIMGGTLYQLGKVAAQPLGKALDDRRQEILDAYNAGKVNEVKQLKHAITMEHQTVEFLALREDLYEAKRGVIDMQLETEYRNRLQVVNAEVKKRLDYQVDLQNVVQNIEETHMAAWVEKEVVDSIQSQSEEDTLLQCIKDLDSLALAHNA